MILEDAVSKLQMFVWILNHISRSIGCSVHPKSIILGQMTNLNMIFHVVVSVYQLVKIWNSPKFPDEFRNCELLTLRDTNSLKDAINVRVKFER